MKKIRRKMANEMDDRRENSSEFSGCWILADSQEFIRRTFAFLPAKTLGICARVCKAWNAEVRRVLQHREEIGWATYGRIVATRTVVETRDLLGPFGVCLNACLDTIGSLPHLTIMFSECTTFESFQLLPPWDTYVDSDSDGEETTFRTIKGALQDAVKDVCSRLPTGCSLVYVNADGSMGCQSDLSPAGDSEGNLGTSCVLLPTMDGVTIDCQQHYPNTLTPSAAKAYIKSHRMPADTKCILVICTGGQHGRRFTEILQRDFHDEYGTMPVIAGGIGKKLMVMGDLSNPVRNDKLPSCLTVAFSGPNVKAASVVLDHSISSKDKARKKILELKKAGLSEKRSLAFIFSCVGRGQHFYEEADVESGVFHEIFPSTPLLGFFGGGEYGCDNLTLGKVVRDDTDDSSDACGKRKEQTMLQSLDKSYTCVVCLLSFS